MLSKLLFTLAKSLLEYTFVKGILYIYIIINDLANVNESILQMMEWKELGILRKGNTLTLPSDFNELEIAIYTTNSSHATVMRISKKNIDRLDYLSTCMWSQSNTDNYNYRFSIKNNEISLNAAKTGSTDITSSTNAHVLYR